MITIMPIRSSSGGKHNNKNRGNKTIIETSAATVMESPDRESRRTFDLTDSYDLIIIGLGPAGSFAAKTASNEGLSVLAIDKREQVGIPVDCGEFYPASTEMPSLMPNVEDYSLLDIPDKFIANKTTQTALISPSGTVHSSSFEGGVLRRNKWLQHVVTEAKQAGTEIWTASKAINVSGDHVRILKGGEELEVQGKVIIGADGTASHVARWVGLPRRLDSHDVCPVKQHRMRDVDIDPNIVEMYLGQDYAPGAYAWIIPRGKNEANVGIGFRRDYVRPGDTMSAVLNRFMTKHPVASERLRGAKIETTISGIVPVTRPAEHPGDTVRGQVMLVGDSARQVIAFVGAGIPPGIITGNIAGRIASEHIHHGVPLIKYEIEWKKQLLDAFQRGYWLKALWDRLARMQNDRKIEWFLNRLSEKNLATIFRNKIPFKLKIGKQFLFLLEKLT